MNFEKLRECKSDEVNHDKNTIEIFHLLYFNERNLKGTLKNQENVIVTR